MERVDWDEAKAGINLWKHGITFEEAATAFEDPLHILLSDPEHSQGEFRFILIGNSIRGRLLVLSFTDTPPSIRLISARRATPKERRNYEEES